MVSWDSHINDAVCAFWQTQCRIHSMNGMMHDAPPNRNTQFATHCRWLMSMSNGTIQWARHTDISCEPCASNRHYIIRGVWIGQKSQQQQRQQHHLLMFQYTFTLNNNNASDAEEAVCGLLRRSYGIYTPSAHSRSSSGSNIAPIGRTVCLFDVYRGEPAHK